MVSERVGGSERLDAGAFVRARVSSCVCARVRGLLCVCSVVRVLCFVFCSFVVLCFLFVSFVVRMHCRVCGEYVCYRSGK